MPNDVTCLNDQCPEFELPKANPQDYDPAEIVCGGCGQPVNTPMSKPPPVVAA